MPFSRVMIEIEVIIRGDGEMDGLNFCSSAFGFVVSMRKRGIL
jgi:hypothetical protein